MKVADMEARLDNLDRRLDRIEQILPTMANAVTVGMYWADVSNPYPWVSGSWPVSGPRAFTGREPDRYGIAITVRERLFP